MDSIYEYAVYNENYILWDRHFAPNIIYARDSPEKGDTFFDVRFSTKQFSSNKPNKKKMANLINASREKFILNVSQSHMFEV